MKNNIFKENGMSILVGLLMGILILNFFLPKKGSQIPLEEFALGKNTKTSMASVGNKKIHCSDLKDLNFCIEGYKIDRNNSPVILWLGNSQLHAINQYQLGNETAAPQIHRILKEYNFHTLTLSQPNANLQEHYLLFTYLLDRLPLKTLILPIVFDDMRENEIRTDIKRVLKDQASYKRINETLLGKSLISRFNDKDLADNKSNVLKDTKQTEFENLLDEKLGNIWSLWTKRDIFRGELLGKLYLLRNSVFGIKATTTRKIIKGSYVKNINAYQDILKLALDNKIKVLVYIPPIRNDIKIPYDVKEYNSFKNEIKNIAEEYKVYFTSLEDLVPSEFWGRKASTNLKGDEEVDFMHFQAEGHRLLAEAIFLEISNIWQLSKKP
ncbi:hypothetical protein OAR24_05340 [Candidatus Pelagibacter sp.]|nr:hypothetical protein [Candidatus Pelagibacter sp.]